MSEINSNSIFATSWIPSTCYMCYSSCGIKVKKNKDTVVEIRGDPANPHNLGKMCAKGKAGVMSLYDPYRLKAPMKRTNPEKGLGIDPGWQEITWEEALTLIVDRLKKIREEDPRQLVLAGLDFNLSTIMYQPFASAFGTPNVCSGSSGYYCGNGLHPVLYSTHATFYAEPDYDHCQYCLNIGSQMGFMVNTNATPLAIKMAEARARGMRVVVVDPVLSNAAAKADEWVPIRPGTDAALVLGMLNIMLNELEAYDARSLKLYTNAPYLVGVDGLYLREPETGKPLVFDLALQRAVPFDSPEVTDPAIEGTFSLTELLSGAAEGRPAFQLLKEYVVRYHPEEVARITTVPAETVTRLAREFATAAKIGSTIVIDGMELPFRPVAVNWNRGAVAHMHGMLTGIAIQLLNTVVGALDVPGGLLGTNPVGPFWAPTQGLDGLIVPSDVQMSVPQGHPVREVKVPETLELRELFPVAAYSRPMLEEAILNGDKYQLNYLPQAMVVAQSNCMMSASNPARTSKMLSRIPFLVVFATHIDETAQMADLLLPDAQYLERLVPFPNRPSEHLVPGEGYWYWALCQPVVAPAGQARPWGEVLIEIARRLGISADLMRMFNAKYKLKPPYRLDPTQPYTWEEVADTWAKSWFGPDHDLSWFKENGVLLTRKKRVEEAFPRPFLKPRIPVYYEHFLRAGQELEKLLAQSRLKSGSWDLFDYQPLPDWKPCPGYNQNPGEGELIAVNYKLPFHTFSVTCQNPWLNELAEHHPYAYRVLINAEAARQRDLADGELVWLESSAGRVKGSLKVTQGIHPECVAIAGTFGHWAEGLPVAKGKGVHFNSLIPFSLERLDKVSAALDACVRVKIYKA